MDFSILNELVLTLIIGITQGFTEFLPISSTAHIRLISSFLAGGRDIGLSTSNVIQIGTLIATLQYFKEDLKQLRLRIIQIFSKPQNLQIFSHNFRSWRNNKNEFQGTPEQISTDITISQLIIGTLPIIVLGALLSNFVDSTRSLSYIASFLITGSLLMAGAEYIHKKNQKIISTTKLTMSEVLLIGLFESLAIFPGISRSGATISGALMIGKGRLAAVRFSFLLSIPAILLAGVVDITQYALFFIRQPNFLPTNTLWSDTRISLSLSSIIIATFFAYLFGYLSLKWLLKYLGNHTTRIFIIYRIVLALILFGVVLAQNLEILKL
ncbi:undecaprenyl-diphosphate phosphatase [Candidatus Gracilibacteria bacterium]|nr:undecaprenyl-diphosphate phosphatase [Candidatus Gracilibacteria bacterium]